MGGALVPLGFLHLNDDDFGHWFEQVGGLRGGKLWKVSVGVLHQ